MSIFDSLNREYHSQTPLDKATILTLVKAFIEKHELKQKWYSNIFTVEITYLLEEETLFILYYPNFTNNNRGCAIVSVNFSQHNGLTELSAYIHPFPKWVRKDYLGVIIIMTLCALVSLIDPTVKMGLLFLGLLLLVSSLLIVSLIWIRYRLKGCLDRLLKEINIDEMPVLTEKDEWRK